MALTPPEANHPLTAIRRTGIVASLSAMPNYVGVNIGGDTTTVVNVPLLSSYAPVVGDTVIMLEVQGDFVVVGSSVPVDTWHDAGLFNFWTGHFYYRKVNNPPNSLQCSARLTSPSAAYKLDTTIVVMLPSGYWPASSQDLAANADVTPSGGQNPHFNVSAVNGHIITEGMTVSNAVTMNGIIPLDI